MQDQFPFAQKLSLQPLIAFWEELADTTDRSGASFIDTLLAQVRDHQALGSADASIGELKEVGHLVEKLLSAVFPMATIDRHIAAAIVPFRLAPFYSTPAFEELDLIATLTPEDNPDCPISQDEMTAARTRKAYHLILERLYGSPNDFNQPFVVGRRDPDSGLNRYFQIEFDTRFVRVHVKGQKPRLAEQTLQELVNDPSDLNRWRTHLPPERFEFSGFGLVRATEVTTQQTLSLIKNGLLDQRDFTEGAGMETLRGHLRSLLMQPDLDIGIVAVSSKLEDGHAVGKSLLLSEECLPECPKAHLSAYARAMETGTSIFVSDIDTADDTTGLEFHVRGLGYHSLAVLPLVENGRVLGLLELASPRAGSLSPRSAARLAGVAPLLATALDRILDERENRIQSLIKKRYTAIHPVVEWRFREEAVTQLGQGERASPTRPIVFENVFPLYGLSDIRNSSSFRNEAIRDDLVQQLGLALAVIIEASSIRPQPALDELGYRLGKQIDDLREGMTADEESGPLRLLRNDVEPLFPKLEAMDTGVARRVADYREALDDTLGMVYRRRKDFEVSITQVNDTLSKYLEAREEEAQRLSPHYFEKYRTDGVDYNIYAGASLQRNGGFDRLDLKNLRIWQLMTMAGCVWEMAALKEQLPLPVDVTHLILVQSQPLAIRFRPDEKKFDVDGAYNIRYEIVKKRIDKAEIAGTGERLTQPGMIAIAYSLPSEEREYRRYLEYLQGAGYLDEGIEKLDLNPLQGVSGLRALRVRVAEHPPVADVLIDLLPDSVTRE